MLAEEMHECTTHDNVHGECDLCRCDGSLRELLGTYHLCSGCVTKMDARVDSRLYKADDDLTYREALEDALSEHLGQTIILHRPSAPDGEHTETIENVRSFEVEFGEENEVHVTYATSADSETFTGKGLTVTGMS